MSDSLGSLKEHRKIAHIVAVNMGYGHERPARVLEPLAYKEKIWIANDYEGIPKTDRHIWEGSRTWYERISRFKNTPILGDAVFGLMDHMQKIPDFYPRRDLSEPTMQVKQFYWLFEKKQWMKDLIDELAKEPKTLITTFMAPAFAAEFFDYPEDIYVLATDADISRAWAPLNPQKTRIRYFAPNGRVAERLRLYGVPEKNIYLTGFPLPMNAIGGTDSSIVLADLERRICRLDPQGVFTAHAHDSIQAQMKDNAFCTRVERMEKGPVHLSFAIGGAGAQWELGIEALKSLRQPIKRGQIVFHFIAGTHVQVFEEIEREIKTMGMWSAYKKGKVQVLFEENREVYFEKFTELIRETDVLWTKPSELSFYTGLGLPIIIAPTIGSQEEFNEQWLYQVGGGVRQMDPRYANEWLMDWIQSGALARAAWNGYIEAPTHGAYRIADVLIGRENSIHPLPLIV